MIHCDEIIIPCCSNVHEDGLVEQKTVSGPL